MKVIFHPRFYEVYTSDPAATAGRMESIVKELDGKFEFIEPGPASERDLERVHGRSHIQQVKGDRLVYEIGCLAAGGAAGGSVTSIILTLPYKNSSRRAS
jgi:hypothetical protein